MIILQIRLKANPKYLSELSRLQTRLFFYGNNLKIIDNIKIAYQDNYVKFTFSSPIFESKKAISSYQLDGFDSNWSDWSSGSLKEYTNLREITCTMKFRSKNSFGIISDVARIPFSISPPWYRSIIAYFRYLIGFGFTIHIIRMRIQAKICRNK